MDKDDVEPVIVAVDKIPPLIIKKEDENFESRHSNSRYLSISKIGIRFNILLNRVC